MLVFCCQPGGARGEVIVPNDSEWKWLHPTDGVDPAKTDKDFHSTFYKADFDDSAWKKGRDKPGPRHGFGYGDRGFTGVDLVQPKEWSHRKSAYFRLKFSTKWAYERLIFKCQRDDGMIVYLDGKEILRDHVGTGKEAYDLFATGTVSGNDETYVNSYKLKKPLAAGDHILAISLHNRPPRSSDMRIAEISLEVDFVNTLLIRNAPPVDPDLITLTVSDGSTIVGKLDVSEIQLTTSYGTLTIPVRKILSFTPGLNSRRSLDDGIRLLIETVGSLQYDERELARRGLTELGVAVRDEIVSALVTEKNARRIKELQAILERIEEHESEDQQDQAAVPSSLLRRDQVVTAKFTATGTIAPQLFKIQSKFGPLTVSMADILKAHRPRRRAMEITTSVTVSGQYIIQKKQFSTEISVMRGDRMTIRAAGELTMTPWGSAARSTPDGNASRFGLYTRGIPCGALLGRIGLGGRPFLIGSQQTFTAKRSGTLYLAIGVDSSRSGNNFPGSYQAEIRLKRD